MLLAPVKGERKLSLRLLDKAGDPVKDADGRVYVPTEDGDVFVFAHGKEERLLHKVEMDQSIKGSLVAANGVLYVTTEKTLYALQLPK